jgi:DNA-binding MarR family transcriptional regulator
MYALIKNKKIFNYFMKIDRSFISKNIGAKALHLIFIKESIGIPELIILSEIAVRRHNNESLPNVKWFQTTLQISFTKVKAVLDPLEEKSLIIKSQAKGDHRVKDINLTEKGFKFISKVMSALPGS